MTRLVGEIEKGWGSETIWVSNNKYCGKLLNFNKGSRFSMHFHAAKDEAWYVLSGKFEVQVIDTITSNIYSLFLNPGDTHRNIPLEPHRLICLEAGTIIEVSTPDSVEDNYRVMPGDSQK